MTRNIKFALFYMFLFGFSVAIALSVIISGLPTKSALIMGVFAVIMLVTAVNYYKKFTRDNDSVLRPTKNGW